MSPPQSPLPILVVVTPLVVSFVLPVVGLWKRSVVFPLAMAALVGCAAASAATARAVLADGPLVYHLGGWPPPWGIAFSVDHLSALLLLVFSAIAVMIGIYSRESVLREVPDKAVPFYSVYLLLVTGLVGIVSTADLFNVYVFLEITSLTSYALVAIGGGVAVVSAFRYVIIGTVGAAFYLLSVGYLYGMTGTLNMADLAERLPALYTSNAVLVAFGFFVVGMAIKMALFPMHTWLPGAYTNAPSAVSAVVASTTTKVATYLLIRVMFYVFEPRFAIDQLPVTQLLSWMGAAAIVLGSVMTVVQTDLKRMLAYSSVAQIGYIVLGIGLANPTGFIGGVLLLVNHAFMKGCLFLVAGAIVYRTGRRRIQDLRRLADEMPWSAAAFTVAALAMIGIPPTGGFFSKLYLLLGAIEAGAWVFVGVMLLSSVLALTYFFNVITNLYVPEATAQDWEDRAGPVTRPRREAPAAMLIPIVVLALAVVGLGLVNGTIVSHFIEPAVPAGLHR